VNHQLCRFEKLEVEYSENSSTSILRTSVSTGGEARVSAVPARCIKTAALLQCGTSTLWTPLVFVPDMPSQRSVTMTVVPDNDTIIALAQPTLRPFPELVRFVPNVEQGAVTVIPFDVGGQRPSRSLPTVMVVLDGCAYVAGALDDGPCTLRRVLLPFDIIATAPIAAPSK